MKAPPTSEPVASGSPLADLTARALTCTRLSRAILLGSRDLRLKSCVTPPKPGDSDADRTMNLADYDGGAGTKLAMLLFLDRQNITHPMEDFVWHQNRLRKYLLNELTENQAAALGDGGN